MTTEEAIEKVKNVIEYYTFPRSGSLYNSSKQIAEYIILDVLKYSSENMIEWREVKQRSFIGDWKNE